MSADSPTIQGIAAMQIRIAIEDLSTVFEQLHTGNEHTAVNGLSTAIRQLEAARRMITG